MSILCAISWSIFCRRAAAMLPYDDDEAIAAMMPSVPQLSATVRFDFRHLPDDFGSRGALRADQMPDAVADKDNDHIRDRDHACARARARHQRDVERGHACDRHPGHHHHGSRVQPMGHPATTAIHPKGSVRSLTVLAAISITSYSIARALSLLVFIARIEPITSFVLLLLRAKIL